MTTNTTVILTRPEYAFLTHMFSALYCDDTDTIYQAWVRLDASVTMQGGWGRAPEEARQALAANAPALLVRGLAALALAVGDDADDARAETAAVLNNFGAWHRDSKTQDAINGSANLLDRLG